FRCPRARTSGKSHVEGALFMDRAGDERGRACAGGEGAAAVAPARAASSSPKGASAVRLKRVSRMSDRYADWRQRAALRLGAIELVPDLAQDIGSRRWLRGA